MAGHSKWAQIKRKKAVTDARRGQLWTKLLKEISVAARVGGGVPENNARLRTAIQEARAANCPNDNIDRAVKKGTGELEGTTYDEYTYEGYGPSGVAVFIEAMTDNKNRTVGELRHIFAKNGGNLGENGCVAWMFDKRGYFAIEKSAMGEEAFMDLAVELGAEDLSTEDEAFEIFAPPEDFASVKEALAERGIDTIVGQLAMIPSNLADVPESDATKVLRLLEALEEHDDVQNVWANFNVDESVLA